MDLDDVLDPGDVTGGLLYAMAWHDVTCVDGQNCATRRLHAMSMPIWTSGVLQDYESRALLLARKVVKRKLQEQGIES